MEPQTSNPAGRFPSYFSIFPSVYQYTGGCKSVMTATEMTAGVHSKLPFTKARMCLIWNGQPPSHPSRPLPHNFTSHSPPNPKWLCPVVPTLMLATSQLFSLLSGEPRSGRSTLVFTLSSKQSPPTAQPQRTGPLPCCSPNQTWFCLAPPLFPRI